jgi:hypothetical protein
MPVVQVSADLVQANLHPTVEVEDFEASRRALGGSEMSIGGSDVRHVGQRYQVVRDPAAKPGRMLDAGTCSPTEPISTRSRSADDVEILQRQRAPGRGS